MKNLCKTFLTSFLRKRGYILRKIGDSYFPPRSRDELFERATPTHVPGMTLWGSRYGGWPMLESILPPNPICYCFGSGTDISFELELACRNPSSEVHLFDPTPRAIMHVQDTLDRLRRNEPATSSAGGESYLYPWLPGADARIHFHAWGVSDKDGMQVFHPPGDPSHVSHSITNDMGSGTGFTAECLCLQTIASRLNHGNVDLMKFDVEGAEYQVIRSFRSATLRPKYLAFEFHPCGFFDAGTEWEHILAAVRSLQELGYALVTFDENKNSVFFRVY